MQSDINEDMFFSKVYIIYIPKFFIAKQALLGEPLPASFIHIKPTIEENHYSWTMKGQYSLSHNLIRYLKTIPGASLQVNGYEIPLT